MYLGKPFLMMYIVPALGLPSGPVSLYNTDKEIYKAGNFINKLSEHATKTQQPFIKGLALFTAMLYFKDFYEQLECTLKFLKNNQDCYWIFRPHPQSDYYGEEKIFKKTIQSYKLKNAI